MPWFVKIERGLVEKAVFDRYVPAHLDYVRQLIAAGHQASSGYWGERGGGMLLFRAESRRQAEQIVAADPLVQAGCVTYELHEWCVVCSATAQNGSLV
ncbi:YciI family protein [Synechococcus elongatus]|uniref:YCII-related domain-containing protein n=2 Tax=Synechococcus elongatus TaxID=32046 RepID=Q31M93_SYNE7|nr:YciI family protein [Synechococcus elongatus]ABB57826.1 conserved hypothetical protein [Synechococcus elongatus PCC 7942 = FACHB-805]AJD57689.1 hypothetical protein M744_07495 [Synechococcus elongatus UTEX 2973]MBD2586542.1 hypothetical protein [Synechococcus elongatus FACHB-242]MBD2687616.1 hypothetical protein [Synechococcus elongatus FACHB-1061]MBD2706675.1 hypothetical protein [Synechococcus elongatus PCC 7942 = FACHB-805]